MNIKRLIHKTTRLVSMMTMAGVAFIVSGCSGESDETEMTPKTIDQYKSELIQFVKSEKTIVDACVVGYNKGDFKSLTTYDTFKADYLAVLVAAETALARDNLTIPDIVAINKSLSGPGKAFTSNLWISDRRPLNDAIVAAEELNTATPEGTAKGEAPPAAKTAFTAAITAAKTVRGAGTTIDRQVTEAVTKLNEAKQVFLNAIVK